MAIATFYHPALTDSDKCVVLSAAESAHAIKSRRLRQGSEVQLINGRGLRAQASILTSAKHAIKVQIDSIEEHAEPPMLSIATAIPKGDRQRTMIDMMSQLGVSKIIPLRCDHSVTKYKPSLQEKWQRIAVEACKQSQNLWLPSISSERNIKELLNESDSLKLYADGSGQSMFSLNKTIAGELTIFIGPEGGFSAAEMSLLNDACVAVNLGSNILRTELACVVAASQGRQISNKL